MAADIFAKIGDIKGESLDDKHKDEVEVLSWSWGVAQSGSISRAAAVGRQGEFNDFNFTHQIDKASPVLLRACATGEHIKEATITVRKAGKGQQEFLIIKMNDIIITSVNPSGSGERAATAENVALQFAKVDLEYKPQKADGSLDAGIHFKYNIKRPTRKGERGWRPRRQPGRSDRDRDPAAAERSMGGCGRHLPQHPRGRARPSRRGALLGRARPSGRAKRSGGRADRDEVSSSNPIGPTGTATWGSSSGIGSSWTRRSSRVSARLHSIRIMPTRTTISGSS